MHIRIDQLISANKFSDISTVINTAVNKMRYDMIFLMIQASGLIS